MDEAEEDEELLGRIWLCWECCCCEELEDVVDVANRLEDIEKFVLEFVELGTQVDEDDEEATTTL